MTIITRSSSKGMLEKKLLLSNLSIRDLIPVKTAEPDISSEMACSMASMRRERLSLLISFSGSFSMKMNHVELSRVPG